MGKIHFQVMDYTGDSSFKFDRTPEGIQEAKLLFDALKRDGKLAFIPGKNGSPGIKAITFDETQSHYIMTPRLIGG